MIGDFFGIFVFGFLSGYSFVVLYLGLHRMSDSDFGAFVEGIRRYNYPEKFDDEDYYD